MYRDQDTDRCVTHRQTVLPPNATRQMGGFSLVELIIVILVLGVLAATALPRFIDQRNNAHISKHLAVAGAFETGVRFAHSIWLLEGAVPEARDIVVFPDGPPPDYGRLAFQKNGWPTNPGNHDPNYHIPHLCGRLFNILVKGATAHQNDTKPRDYNSGIDQNKTMCVFKYVAEDKLMFTYTFDTGEIEVDSIIED